MEYFINETVPAQCNCGQAVEKTPGQNIGSEHWRMSTQAQSYSTESI